MTTEIMEMIGDALMEKYGRAKNGSEMWDVEGWLDSRVWGGDDTLEIVEAELVAVMEKDAENSAKWDAFDRFMVDLMDRLLK